MTTIRAPPAALSARVSLVHLSLTIHVGTYPILPFSPISNRGRTRGICTFSLSMQVPISMHVFCYHNHQYDCKIPRTCVRQIGLWLHISGFCFPRAKGYLSLFVTCTSNWQGLFFCMSYCLQARSYRWKWIALYRYPFQANSLIEHLHLHLEYKYGKSKSHLKKQNPLAKVFTRLMDFQKRML